MLKTAKIMRKAKITHDRWNSATALGPRWDVFTFMIRKTATGISTDPHKRRKRMYWTSLLKLP